MQNIVNKEISPWIKPWELEKFDNIYNRDDRFFSLVIKGMLSWLNRNIILYNKPIIHFIFNSGSSYLYMESNGYEYNMSETSGEDQIYMSLPRCIVSITNMNLLTEELSSGHIMGTYNRIENNEIAEFASIIKRIPIQIDVTLKYVLANLNESFILMQEIIDKIIFNKYYTITYLGKTIECQLEFPADYGIEINTIDMETPDQKYKTIELSIKLYTSYPMIDSRSEIRATNIIQAETYNVNSEHNDTITDSESSTYGD